MSVSLVPLDEFSKSLGGLDQWYTDNATQQIGAPAEYAVIVPANGFSQTYFAIQRFADERQIRVYFFNYHTIFVGRLQDAILFRLGFEE